MRLGFSPSVAQRLGLLQGPSRLLVVRPLPLAVRAATQGNNHHEPSTSDAPTDSVDEAWLSEFEGLLTKIKSDRSVRQERESDTDPREKVFLVAATTKDAKFNQTSGYSFKESLEELGRLADTAGLRVMGSTYQVLEDPNPRTYIGTGKVTEIAASVAGLGVETVIFDDELSPGQQRNLEKALGRDVRICDRTALILDIFSQRAATREGKLQVELAQIEYQTPRLSRMWSHLDRVTGGGLTKGTGEKQIEIDRRLLKSKSAQLKKELQEVRQHRKMHRRRRAEQDMKVVAIVGYTNAGKSTLLNRLTKAQVLAEDKLFATLDPTTRRVNLPSGKEALLTDTVGFIQKLPTQLVAAFRATLEEIEEAQLLLHVIDVSSPLAAAQSEAVEEVLKELNTEGIDVLTVWNKVDQCADPAAVRTIAAGREDTCAVSAVTGEGLQDLLELIERRLMLTMQQVDLLLPYSAGDLLEECHRTGSVESEDFTESGTRVRATVPYALAGRLRPFAVEGSVISEEAQGEGARARAGAGRNPTKIRGKRTDLDRVADAVDWAAWE